MKTILILSVNPPGTTRLRLDREVREIQATLKRSKYRDSFQIVTEGAVRVDDLRRALLEYQPAIVHFSGHGVGTEGLVLENDAGQTQLVSNESLGNLFNLFQTKIECVLLNACYSEIQAQVIHQYIDYLIGMNQPIGDEAAIKFATGFYDALGAGEPYERCFEIGCASIALEGMDEADTPKLKARPRPYAFLGIKELEESAKIPPASPPVQPITPTETTTITDNRRIKIGKGNFTEIKEGNNTGKIGRDYIVYNNNYSLGNPQSNLADAATELQKLLDHLGQSYSTETTLGKMQIAAEAVKQIENNPRLSAQIRSAIAQNGIQEFQQRLKHPAAHFVIGALEDWQKTQNI
ncbi:CHAT domain-containing protein [Laspinema olomoucense]|uniref:CHAT domain-containing protein n=1 Tax=Laspinema olomoucense D3b TaxID=2953688 RepID=A0ABT2N5I6_9CYAN|nr:MULTISPECIES: CHAT domain-containing protein [unclassified Laspinema]MCT7977950.1 CHAT domain-containing protein [Laspinema sp. D3b]MCT7994276.1 CHAT domain-containing protein [Laspinema sp. D3c]